MGYECGFYIVPELDEEEHSVAYENFILEVIDKYENAIDHDSLREDGKILMHPFDGDIDRHESGKLYKVIFKIGDCPEMPYWSNECEFFLRFSSEVSGKNAPAKTYIKEVCKIAKKHFGYRVRFWHQLNEDEDGCQNGFYSSKQIEDARKRLDGEE